ncbi:MAG: hypothetical protein KDA61_21200 [Planctomycetales bacterium]|nr:hypothetical protein [Planctomycetales bacterium]
MSYLFKYTVPHVATFALLALAIGVVAPPAFATLVLFQDDFEGLENGELVSQNGWAKHSGVWSPVQTVNGAVSLVQGSSNRQDVHHLIGDATMAPGDVWRAEFDVSVSSAAPLDATVYFAHFMDAASEGSEFNSRVFVAPPTTGGDFTFGIAEHGDMPEALFAWDFEFSTNYRLFVEYDFDSATSRLWVDSMDAGVIMSTNTEGNLGRAVNAIALRQGQNVNGSMTIDNLLVSAVPEAAAFWCVGLAAIVLAARHVGRKGSHKGAENTEGGRMK